MSVEEQQKEIDYWRWQLSVEKLRVNELEGRIKEKDKQITQLRETLKAEEDNHNMLRGMYAKLDGRLAEIQQLIEETSIIIADGTQKVRICEFIEKLEKIVKGQEEK